MREQPDKLANSADEPGRGGALLPQIALISAIVLLLTIATFSFKLI